MPDASAYRDSLLSLAEPRPLIARSLRLAEERRAERLAGYIDGMRLKGLEQLHAYLDAAVESFTTIPVLANLAFLVSRVQGDFETALEATLSGYQGVAADAMRDVMEIEGLLLDFATHPGNAQEWLHADRKLLIRKYGPAAVRDRLKVAGVSPYSNEGFEPLDYQAHSQALHVTPPRTMLDNRGPEAPDLPSLLADLGFIEMFEHGHRILFAIEATRVIGLGLPDDYTPLTPMDDFDAAYERTREMQVIVIAFLQAPQVLHDELGRQPTASEVLEYVADEVESKSPRSTKNGSRE